MEDETLLLTGATGFVGGATLARLLQDGAPCRILLLVRAATAAEGLEQVRRSVARFGARPLDSCEVLAADLTDPRSLDDARLDCVTRVLHLAANTSFRSVRGVRRVNLHGTLHLAHRMRRAPLLRRFLHVGTAYVCGVDAPRVVHEDEALNWDATHLVEYTRSKAEAEMLLRTTAPELPLIVARPSIVVGHTELGCEPSSSIFWVYRAIDALRRTNFPLDSYDDVVPVDYVARALLLLLFKPRLHHDCYHVSSGEVSAVTWHEIAAVFADVFGERPGEPFRQVDFETIVAERHRLAALFGPGNEEHLLEALRIYYRFAEAGVEIFDNSRLLAEGMPPPPKFTSYLHLCATRPAGRSIHEQMHSDE